MPRKRPLNKKTHGHLFNHLSTQAVSHFRRNGNPWRLGGHYAVAITIPNALRGGKNKVPLVRHNAAFGCPVIVLKAKQSQPAIAHNLIGGSAVEPLAGVLSLAYDD